ncbi:hypothetical protein D9613_006026 [Agrocybe pediades]|uniref:HPt domain-containing protein n=1 Tax=Agrocybe pediades TaxID=84607 RepID=A0A8H4QVF4_9AGAR|nr:hypothetical protein D9613_006026 [Agrocybe pediades]
MPVLERTKDDPRSASPPRRSLSPEPPARPSQVVDPPSKEPIKSSDKPVDKPVDKEKPVESKPGEVNDSASKAKVEAEPEEDKDDNSGTDLIDEETFNQLLELDEDEETHDFSKPMVWDYFEQAVRTFGEMDEAFAAKDLKRLSSLGHFLKGSSAALGLSRVKNTCEKIQNTGNCRDEETGKDLTDEAALKVLARLLKRVKVEYNEAEVWLKNFYGED